jgi:hypothetical protein
MSFGFGRFVIWDVRSVKDDGDGGNVRPSCSAHLNTSLESWTSLGYAYLPDPMVRMWDAIRDSPRELRDCSTFVLTGRRQQPHE